MSFRCNVCGRRYDRDRREYRRDDRRYDRRDECCRHGERRRQCNW